MNDIIEMLKKSIILSITDIKRMKQSVYNSYAHLSSYDRAEILSLAIHNLINKHLEGIESSYKEVIKLNILKSTLSQHVYTITKHNIFESIISLELPEEKRLLLAESWLMESAQIRVTKRSLKKYLASNYAFSAPRNSWRLAILMLPLLISALIILFAPTQKSNSPADGFSLKSHLMTEGEDGIARLDKCYIISNLGNTSNAIKWLPFGIGHKTNDFEYTFFNYFNIKHYIATTRNGLIAQPEYFNRLIHLAHLNDIDPLLLLAIIGQEQAFVSQESVHALNIINNPFNVFHSWMNYNTTLRDSTKIAINTIKNRMAKKPSNVSPFLWLNGVYAEDPNWHNGVTLIYSHLKKIGSF